MSLGIVIKGPEGVVLAADSRVTLSAERKDASGSVRRLDVNFDSAKKLLTFTEPHKFVGVVTYGAAVIGLRTAKSFIPEFELTLKEERLHIEEYATLLSDFFQKQWSEVMPKDYSGPDMTFVVAGYDPEGAYGSVYSFGVPSSPEPEQQNPGENFGMTWGGQLGIVSRLIRGFDPIVPQILQHELNLEPADLNKVLDALKAKLGFTIPYQVLPLQDCVDLAILMIRTTIDVQNLGIGVRGVGGKIEVATITRTGELSFVQQKKLHGE